jgi:hypothetical protein
LVAASSTIRVWTDQSTAHEGHGGPGPLVTLTAWVQPRAGTFRSPITGAILIPVTNSPAGITVEWIFDDVFYQHASEMSADFVVNAAGEAKVKWQVRPEPGDGQGYETKEMGFGNASVQASDLIGIVYGRPDLGALVPSTIISQASVEFAWHEPEAMAIVLKNHYDASIGVGIGATHGVGDDEFSGVLTQREDGTWQGIVVGSATGQQDSNAFRVRCTSRWHATQKVLVVAGQDPAAQFGDFTFTFFPVAEPTGSTGRGKCPPTRWRQGGVSYAPYGDYNIHEAAAGLGLTIVLPQRPGGHVRVPVPPIPGSGITNHDSYWDIDIQFLGP